jgi:hypothetical protein
MLNFQAVRENKITFDELIAGLTKDDLVNLTNEMVDTIIELIQDCGDPDVFFVPEDPDAYDPFAEDEEDVDLAWTLGHVIVHVNASSEESAALAAELARGVEFHGRSRFEIPWESVITIDECRQRLEESRRMCLASLDMWPSKPHLDNFYQSRPEAPRLNAIGRFVYGFSHAESHLMQIQEIVCQARDNDKENH